MNVKKIKEVLKCVGGWIAFAFAIAFTVIFVISYFRGTFGDNNAGEQIRTELISQTEENRKLRSEIDTLQKQRTERERRITELQGTERELAETNKRLEELREAYAKINSEFEGDLREMGTILQDDRESIKRIREILQDKDN